MTPSGLPLWVILPALLLVLAALALVALALVRRARIAAEGSGLGEDPTDVVVDFSRDPGAARMRASFAQAMALLARMGYGRRKRYELPWYLMLGGSGPVNDEVLASLNINLPYGEPSDSGATPEAPVEWWIYDRAVVLQAAGAADASSVGGASSPGSWFRLMAELKRARPARPLDGLIVTLPAVDLLEPAPASGQSAAPSALEERSQWLFARVTQAEQALGFRFPLYVLVTGTEVMPGFGSLVSTLSPAQRAQIFGWASPYPLATAYSPTWVGQALGSLSRHLYNWQLQVFGGSPTGEKLPKDLTDFFVFPERLTALAEPLATVLNHLFLPSAAADPCFFRGLYFCGSRRRETLREEAEIAPNVHFVQDLFADKIFPERALAQPAGKVLSRRTLERKVAQGLCLATIVAGLLGLWLGPKIVSSRVAALSPWLDQVAAALPPQGTSTAGAPSTEEAADLLVPMNRIAHYDVETWALPASWWSGVDAQVRGAVTAACEQIFLPAIGSGLTGQRSALVGGTYPPPHPATLVVGLPLATGEFQDLLSFTEAVLAVEKEVAEYDGLVAPGSRSERRLAAFESLSAAVLNVKLDPPTLSARWTISRALRKVEEPPSVAIALAPDSQVQSRAGQDADGFFRKVFGASYTRISTRSLARQLQNLGQDVPPEQELARLERVNEQVDRTGKILVRPDQQWVGAATFAPGAAYEGVLAGMARSAWLGPTFAATVEQTGDVRFSNMQKALAREGSPYTGPVLVSSEGQVQLALSPGVLTLQEAIQGLLGEPFVGSGTPAWQTRVPPRTRLVWDVPTLNQAAGLDATYQQFLTQGIQAFSKPLQAQVTAVATQQLSDKVGTLLGQAQSFVPVGDTSPPVLEPQVQQQSPAFQAASVPLGQILTFSQQLGLNYGYLQLAGLIQQQALDLLGDSTRLLDGSNLYVPKGGDFSWWEGEPPPSPTAFGATSASGLTSYLTSQRGRATQVAGYAQPVLSGAGIITALEPGFASQPLVTSWNAILATLSGYSQKAADNTLSALETFISQPMTMITVDNCAEELGAPQGMAQAASRTAGKPGSTGRSGGASGSKGSAAFPRTASLGNDFFAEAEGTLQAELAARCAELTVAESRRGYVELAVLFNRSLAGRYPFAEHDPAALGGEATPESIYRFFERYDRYAPVIDQAPDRTFGAEAGEVRQFMRQMQEVRAFFAPYLAAGDLTQPPAFDFVVTFRTNRGHEANGNEVFSWALQTGSQTISATNPLLPVVSNSADGSTAGGTPPSSGSSSSASGGSGGSGSGGSSGSSSSSPSSSSSASASAGPAAVPIGRWTYGTPVQVTLGWASNSPWQPAPRGQGRHAAVSGGAVTWEYDNAWALLSLLRDQAASAADFDAYADPQPQTLRFRIATQAASQDSTTATLSARSTRVYVRLQLQTPDQKQGLRFPAVFPTQAPMLRR